MMVPYHSLELFHGSLIITTRLCGGTRPVRDESLVGGCEQTIKVMGEMTDRGCAGDELGGHFTGEVRDVGVR